ncbi:MAG: DUF3524 domain-containing protein [Pirellulaceae bacterium]
MQTQLPHSDPLRVLVLEPFGVGSHAAMNRGWKAASQHELTLLELPGVHWKWRSRHGSLTLARQAIELWNAGQRFDVVFCSDMLNLPEWRGFAGPLASLPSVAYFHENQFTYPLATGQTRDFHYAYSNVLTCTAADRVWFNSDFHRQEFGDAVRAWLRRMPDYAHLDLFEAALARSQICPPGIQVPDLLPRRDAIIKARTPLTIGWVARWEHDKRPDRFLELVRELLALNLEFRLVLLGQQFRHADPSFLAVQELAGSRVLHSGYAASRDAYWHWLSQIDLVLSTADHEFFGIGVLEAVAAGAKALLPRRLAYPEVFELTTCPDRVLVSMPTRAS